MSTSPAPEGRLVDYLLGRMPEEERAQLEERLFDDGDLDQELLATTDDLIRAYLAGVLSEEDRARFETHFVASPENREQLALTKDLLAAVERTEDKGAEAAGTQLLTSASRSSAWALAAVVLLTVAVAVVVATRWMGHGTQRTVASPLPTVAATASPEPEHQMAAVQVVRINGKSGGRVKVHLSPSAHVVRVQVTVDPDSLSFDAAVRDANGMALWRADGLAAPVSGKPLVLEVPALVFASGRYTLRVEAESLRESAASVLEYHLEVVLER